MKVAAKKPVLWDPEGLIDYLRANKIILLLSVIVCLLISIFVQVSRNPTYKVKSTISIAGLQRNNNTVDANNSVTGLKSRAVLHKAIEQSSLLVSYETAGGKAVKELYADDAPVQVQILRIRPEAYGKKLSLIILDNQSVEIAGLGRNEKYDFNTVVYTPSADFRIVRSKEIYAQKELVVRFNNPDKLASAYAKKLNIKPGSDGNEITLTVTESHPQKGVDFLNTLSRVYSGMQSGNKKQNAREMTTIRDSIAQVRQELTRLSIPEMKKAMVKKVVKRSGKKPGKQQIQTLAVLKSYLDKPFDNFNILPAYPTNDKFLDDFVASYNDLQQKRTTAEIKTGFDAELRVMQKKMIARIQNIENQETINTVTEQPVIYRMAKTDKRLKKAKEDLLSRLNHEEDSLQSASQVPAVAIVKKPSISRSGFVFEATLLYLGAILLGLVLPMPVIYARNAITKNVLSVRDIQAVTDFPVAGVFGHQGVTAGGGKNSIADYGRYKYEWSLLIKQIEMMKRPRTGTVISLSSSQSGEGKSYLSQNLSLMLSGKDYKVVFVDLNIIDNENDKEEGVINFLLQQNDDIKAILKPSPKNENLFYIGPGHSEKKQVHSDLPFYQWELGKIERDRLKSPRVKQLITQLRKSYDFVILDTPSYLFDPFIGSVIPLADVRMHVVRYNFTRKSMLKDFNAAEKNNENVYIIFNDIKHTSPQFYKALHQNN